MYKISLCSSPLRARAISESQISKLPWGCPRTTVQMRIQNNFEQGAKFKIGLGFPVPLQAPPMHILKVQFSFSCIFCHEKISGGCCCIFFKFFGCHFDALFCCCDGIFVIFAAAESGAFFLVIYKFKINTTHNKTTTKMHICVFLDCTELMHFLKYIVNKLIETKLLFSKILINYTTG